MLPLKPFHNPTLYSQNYRTALQWQTNALPFPKQVNSKIYIKLQTNSDKMTSLLSVNPSGICC